MDLRAAWTKKEEVMWQAKIQGHNLTYKDVVSPCNMCERFSLDNAHLMGCIHWGVESHNDNGFILTTPTSDGCKYYQQKTKEQLVAERLAGFNEKEETNDRD